MRRKLRIFSNIAIICLSVCMFAFGVYAANQVSITTSGTVTFTAQNVEATISRKLYGFNPDKGTYTTSEDKDPGVFIQEINKSTAPEGATFEFENLKNEDIHFKNGHEDIVMEFKITNDSDDKDLFVKLIDHETSESTNVVKIAESLGGEILVEPGDTKQFCIYLDVVDANVSASAHYNYEIQLNNTTDAIEIDETMVTMEDISIDGSSYNNAITGWADGFDASKLTNIIIPNTLGGEGNYIIPSSAFNNLPNLKNVMFRRNIDHVYNAFNRCTGLEYVNLNMNMDAINSFANCTGVKSLYVGCSLTTPLVGCPNIQAITFGDWAGLYDGALFGDDESYSNTNRKVNWLGTLSDWNQQVWGSSLQASPLYGGGDLFLNGEEVVDLILAKNDCEYRMSFSDCNSIKTVTLAADVSKISDKAFVNCKNLTTITIQATALTYVYDSALYCPALKQINFAGTKESWKGTNGISDLMAFNNPNDSSERDTISQVTVSCSDGNLRCVYVDEQANWVWQDVA